MKKELDDLFPGLKKFRSLKRDETIGLNKNKLTLKKILNKFNVTIECSNKLLNLLFKNDFKNYEINEYNQHRIYGQDDTALYELLIDENNKHNFLEYHITRLDHSPSVIRIYDIKGNLVLMT